MYSENCRLRLQRLSHCHLFLFSSLIASLCHGTGSLTVTVFFLEGACLSRFFLAWCYIASKAHPDYFWVEQYRSVRIRSWLKAAESMTFNFRKTSSFLHMCGLGKSITAFTAWWSVRSQPASTECSTCSSCRVITKSKISPLLWVGWWTC